MIPVQPLPHSPWPHRLAWLLACATFPLVWWGGFVTATGSGMAFREWLTPDGAWLPLYPWLSSAGDKFIEHGHRLLAMAVGMLTIAFLVVVHLKETRRSVRLFSWALLAGVLLQGAIGGLRVVLDERLLALVHGCVGPLFFAATAAMVALTSSRWQAGAQAASTTTSHAPGLVRLAVLTAVLAWLQLVLGAIVRHSPYLMGDGAAVVFRMAVYSHLAMAVAVVVHVLRLAAACWRQRVDRPVAVSLALLIIVQLALGASTWVLKYGAPRWAASVVGEWNHVNTEADLLRAGVITAHGAVGALLVALCVVAALDAARSAGFKRQRYGAVLAQGAMA